ncbi:MAG: S8 family peptidase [Elusimicrobia bacterium]|nr:S8 family peptidase [Elusimicrobiota bacterium]
MRWPILAAFVLSLASAAVAQETLGSSPTQRIVVFKSHTTPASRVTIAAQSGASVLRELRLIDAVVIKVAAAQAQAAESALKARPEVVRVDPDPRINWLEAAPATVADAPWPSMQDFLPRRFELSDPPPASDDPGSSAGQEKPWGIGRVNAPAAWAVTKGKGVKVGVVDTGIDVDHADLKANIAGGWNAIDKEHPDNFKDDNGHGTHVAGTIAAVDDEAGVVGVAPQASLYGVKVLDKDGGGTFSDVIAGMEWTVANKMQVVNMSLGAARGNDSLKAAVEAMAKAGVILVAAAGNSGGAVGFPAAYPGAIAIAAMDSKDKVASFSSRGLQVAFIAPGVAVRSTYMGGGYSSLSGTSMACPHAVGLAALAVAAKGLGDTEALRAHFKANAAALPGVPAEQQGAGVVDAAKLVQ